MNLLSIDPGVTTGIAFKLDEKYSTSLIKDQNEIWNLVRLPMWDVVIYENFKCVVISTYGLYTVRLIGGILASAMFAKHDVCKHEPIFRYSQQQKAKDMLPKGTIIHEVEALAHLLAHEVIHVNN